MCVWVQGFSATAWILSHISRMERQSYYTTENGLKGAAASMVRHNGPGYSLDWSVTKPGIWFMGQFRVGRASVLIHLPLLLALMRYSKLPYSGYLDDCRKIKLWFSCIALWLKDWKKGWKQFFTAQGWTCSSLYIHDFTESKSVCRQKDSWLIEFYNLHTLSLTNSKYTPLNPQFYE